MQNASITSTTETDFSGKKKVSLSCENAVLPNVCVCVRQRVLEREEETQRVSDSESVWGFAIQL